jgi:predicted transcriptional regulator
MEQQTLGIFMTRTLTEEQKRKAIALFQMGVQHYTDISARLDLPYQAVNTFMTKWKYDTGILKRRRTRSDKKPLVEKRTSNDWQVRSASDELAFLRRFYLKAMQEDLKGKDEGCVRMPTSH